MSELPPIEQRFASLVQMVQRDVNALQNAINMLQQEVAALKQGRGQAPAQPQAMNGLNDVVGIHPVTRQPVTAAEVQADPKLGLRMRFGEEEA